MTCVVFHRTNCIILYCFRKPDRKSSANGGGPGTGGSGGMPENAHIFQEYTYKKITPCDICSQILRGRHVKIN